MNGQWNRKGGRAREWKERGVPPPLAPCPQQAFPKPPSLTKESVWMTAFVGPWGLRAHFDCKWKHICIGNVFFSGGCFGGSFLLIFSDTQAPENSAGRPFFCCYGHQGDTSNPAADLHLYNAVQCLNTPDHLRFLFQAVRTQTLQIPVMWSVLHFYV